MKKLFIALFLVIGAAIICQGVIAYNKNSGKGSFGGVAATQRIPIGGLVSASDFTITFTKGQLVTQQHGTVAQQFGTIAQHPGTIAQRTGTFGGFGSNQQNQPFAKVTLNNVNLLGTTLAQNAQDHQDWGMGRTASIFNQKFLQQLGAKSNSNRSMLPVVLASGNDLMLMNAQNIQYFAAKNQITLSGNVIASTASAQNFGGKPKGAIGLAALNSNAKFLGYNANNQTANFASYNQFGNAGILTLNFDNLDYEIGINGTRMQQASVTFAIPKYH